MSEYKRYAGGFADERRAPWVHESGRKGCEWPYCDQPVGLMQSRYCLEHRTNDSYAKRAAAKRKAARNTGAT